MTTNELIQLVRDLGSFDLDNTQEAVTGTTPSAAAIVTQLNWALHIMGKRCYMWSPSIAMTLTASSYGPYRLDNTSVFARRVIKPFRVRVNNLTLLDHNGEPGIWPYARFERSNPAWLTATDDMPSAAVLMTNNILIWPPPSATVVAAGGNTVAGQVLPLDLSSSTGSVEPELPVGLHEALAELATVKAAYPVISEPEAWQRLAFMNSSATALVDELRRENWNAVHGSFDTPRVPLIQVGGSD